MEPAAGKLWLGYSRAGADSRVELRGVQPNRPAHLRRLPVALRQVRINLLLCEVRAMLTTQGGIVGAALDEAQRPQCPRCERCGCGLIGGPSELMLCSTCLPAEVLQLRELVRKVFAELLEQKRKSKSKRAA